MIHFILSLILLAASIKNKKTILIPVSTANCMYSLICKIAGLPQFLDYSVVLGYLEQILLITVILLSMKLFAQGKETT